MTPLDETPCTVTLPAYVWAILRSAARREHRRCAYRDLNEHRATALSDAAEAIEASLPEGSPARVR